MRLAIVTSHPIQYQAPWFRALARRVELHVFFCHRQDAVGQAAAGYGQSFSWDVPLLDGYEHSWLTNVAADPGVFSFRGCDTPGVADALGRGQFDACIVSGWYLKSYVQAILACRRQGLPVFLRGDSQRATDRPLITRALKYPLYRALLTSVDGHLAVGQSNRQYLEHYGVNPRRIWFVPHCVDDRWFAQRADAARSSGAVGELRRHLRLDDEERVVLFVGRLVDQKRPLDFVEAIGAVRRTERLAGVVVGSGPLAGALEARSRELGAGVRFAGFVNQSALPAYYAAARLLVLPSDSRETWGLVANEALSCGTPIVVSDHAGCAADLVTSHTGRAYPCGNVGTLASAILEVDHLRRAAPAEVSTAVETVSRRYGVEAAADAAAAALEAAVTRASRSTLPMPQSIRS